MKESNNRNQLKKWIKVGHCLEKRQLHEMVNKAFGKKGEAVIGPLLSLECSLYGARHFAQKIVEMEDGFEALSKKINDYYYRLDNPEYLEYQNYQFCFFCCCGKAYQELRLFQEYLEINSHIDDLLEKLKPLKDLRDGFVHGAEDNYEELTKDWDEINWKNRLRKGALPKITGLIAYLDMEANIKLIEDIYRSFVSLFIRNND